MYTDRIRITVKKKKKKGEDKYNKYAFSRFLPSSHYIFDPVPADLFIYYHLDIGFGLTKQYENKAI